MLRRIAFVGLVMIAFVGGVLFAWEAGIGSPAHPDEFALMTESWELLHSEYVDAEHLDPSALAHAAISGMADAVGDTGHTYFLTPEEAAEEMGWLSGAYVGIGVEFSVEGDPTTISYLVPGAPASEAGLEVGDRIVEVDGAPTDGPDVVNVLERIRGAPDTEVDLTVVRAGRMDRLEFRITRAEIEAPAVAWAMIPGATSALLKLSIFSEGAGDELRGAVSDAQKAGATGVVLDLRGNPGGLVEEAVGVASSFMGPDQVVFRERDASGVESVEMTSPDAAPTDLRLVVLVDGESVSAAEIVAGALQDSKRATVIGSRTFGTGTILSDYPLADGSDLAIGTSRWYTPDGRSVWHVGLSPDIEVSMPSGAIGLTPDDLAWLTARTLAESGDAQLLRAIDWLGT